MNSVTVSEKNLPLSDPTVASIINPAAVLPPPAPLAQQPAVNFRPAQNNFTNGQTVYPEKVDTVVPNCGHKQMNGVDSLSVASRLSTSSEEGKPNVVEKRDPNDYIFGKAIGEGSFSTVYLAKDIHTNMICASMYYHFYFFLSGGPLVY